MKNFIQYFFSAVIVSVLLAVSGCKYDDYVKAVPVNVTTPVSYDTIVQPIFNTHCAVSGCHVPGAQAPDLTAANSYNNLFLYGLVDTTNPSGCVLMGHLTGTGYSLMPPVGALSPLQIGQILAWIKQGGLDD